MNQPETTTPSQEATPGKRRSAPAAMAGKLLERLRHPLRHWRSTCAVVLVVLVVIGGLVVWNQVKDRFIPRRWGVVEPGRVFRSGLLSKELVKRTLQKHGIGVVVSLINEERDRPDQDAERRVCAELGIRRVVLPLAGNGTGDITRYADAIEAILQARRESKPVLVHCVAGVSRTGGVIAMYRVLIEKRSPAEAYEEMCDYGYDGDHRPELLAYLNRHMGELAAMLVARGILDRVPNPLPRLGP